VIEYAVAVGSDRLTGRFFGPSFEALADVPARRVGDILTEFDSDAARQTLARADVLFTGWETPQLTAEVLHHAPRLRRVIHVGGYADGLFPDGKNGILTSDVGAVNSVPVAEYSLAMILLANKDTFRAQQLYRERRAHIDREVEFEVSGNYRRTVGVVSASRTGRLLLELLRPFPALHVLLYDPYVTQDEAAKLGVEPVPLKELMSRSDVVTLQTPLLPETEGLIDAALLARMPDGATLINTARGAIVEPEALERELVSGRISAVLDVTEPEPLPASSPLYDLPNVLLTPHIAGSMGTELRRMGDMAAADLVRYVQSEA
jgi:phosphoglycerate dehydrogenase-like enzyme